MGTAYTQVAKDTWTKVCTGACLVDIKNHALGRLFAGSTPPADQADPTWHEISKRRPFSYGGTAAVWVFTTDDRGLEVVVTDGA